MRPLPRLLLTGFGLFAFAIGCAQTTEDPPPPGADTGVTGTPDTGVADPVDTGTPNADAGVVDTGMGVDVPPVTLGPCVAPSPLPADPMTLADETILQRLPGVSGVVHTLDIEIDPTGRVLLVGTGGLFMMVPNGGGFTASAYQRRLWNGQTGGNRAASFHKLEFLNANYLATSNRDLGVALIDISADDAMPLVGQIPIANASGLGVIGDRLLVLTHTGDLVTVNVSDPTAPAEIGTITGFGNPWEMRIVGDRAYVADNALGLIVVDVSSADTPSIIATIPVAGAAQDVDVDGDKLFVAVGTEGIEVFDISNRDAPTSVSRLEYGAAVVSVSASPGLVFATTHEQVVVADTSNPAALLPLATEDTPEWAMNVVADGAQAYVADWARFEMYVLNPAVRSPDADPSRSELYYFQDPPPGGETTVELFLANRGGAPLTIAGGGVEDSRFTVLADRTEVLPGQQATITVDFADDGAPVDTTLCLSTNDPETPLQQVRLLESNNTNTSIGESAPDFDLPDVNDPNVRYRLSEQLGNPVVLVYFATW